MTANPPAVLQRLLQDEFERLGWHYDLNVGREIVDAAQRAGTSNAAALANSVSAEFLTRNRASRGDVADAIERAIGGMDVAAKDQGATKLVFNDRRKYELKVGKGASIRHSNLNVGDHNQINVNHTVDRDQLLGAVEALLLAGLGGEWNRDAARHLSDVIDARDDVAIDDVRSVVVRTIESETPKQGRVRRLLHEIATSGIGGALGTGLSAGMGELLAQLPL